MIKADAFAAGGTGPAADSRLRGITRALAETYAPAREEALPERLAVLVARLKSTERSAPDRK